MNVAAIVPSLNPDEKFLSVISGLADAGFAHIYVVNDGSDDTFSHYFEAAAAYPQCTVLVHEENKGKGRALKTAFARYLEDNNGCVGVVTLDADGQHSTEDVVMISKELEKTPDMLILGARDFSQAHVPKKSALGNKITRTVFKMVCGIPITDTQTGLRGIPNSYLAPLLDISGERYEFETTMLLEAKRAGVRIREMPISTIYIDNNATSHFRPLVDGMRIYILILKFTFASIASFLVDFGLFALLEYILLAPLPGPQRKLIATVVARVCSAFFNFFVNHRIVFVSKAGMSGSMVRYAILCVVQMLCSYGGVYLLSEWLPLPTMASKLITDCILFFISFFIQRRWVFRATENPSNE